MRDSREDLAHADDRIPGRGLHQTNERGADDPVSDRRKFGWAMAVVALGALALRVEYVLTARRNFHPGGDAYFYHAGANLLADGRGFISPFYIPAHLAAADHPPLYLVYLSVGSLLGMRSVAAHLLWSSVLGTGTVVLLGVLGRRVAGDTVGIIAAIMGALYPNLWAPDVGLLAETASMFFVTLAILLAFYYRDRPSWRRLALVGLACALGAMARAEVILLIPLLAFPLALATRDTPMRDRLVAFGAAVAAAAIVIAPWAAYNQTRFTHPVILSAGFGQLVAASNCDSTYYYGPLQGYFDEQCTIAADKRAGITSPVDESVEDAVARRAAFDYIRGHLSKFPSVEGIRLLRIVGLYHPQQYIAMDNFLEGRSMWVSRWGTYSFYALALLSIAGSIAVRRARHVPLWPMLTPIGVVLITVLVTYASTRFRTTAEPMLVVLAAVALHAAWRVLHRRDQQALPVYGPPT
jgi:4-amino-4-deoxy-L-arabinose transferase-like glycosyltransferase